MKRFSSIACVGHRSKKVTGATAFQTLMATKAPWGRYSADSWVSGTNTLTDLTGNGRHATTSGVTSGAAAGNGAAASIAYLAGSTTGTISWPSGSVPAVYTMAFLTRYSTTGSKMRLLIAGGNIYGHWNGCRGVYYEMGWKTGQASTGTLTNWLNAVATNSTSIAAPANFLIDGTGSATGNGGDGSVRSLAINAGTGETSDFQFSQLLIWDQVLTAAEMATVAAALTTYLSTGVLQTPTAFQTLIATKVPWGRYSAASWVSGTNALTDLTGNGRHATTANLTSGAASGNGATASIAYLAGSTTGTIVWPSGSIPAAHTICSISRYSGGTSGRVLTRSGAGNFIHGHHANRRGLSYAGAWRTSTTSVGTLTNWLNFCVTSGNTTPANALTDGASTGVSTGTDGSAVTLGINTYTGETADFQFSQLLIWDQVLTADEMAVVSAALTTYMATGALL